MISLRIICVAKKMRFFGAASLSSGSMLIVNGLPLGAIHNFVPNEHVRHNIPSLRSVYRFSLTKGKLNAF